MDGHASLYAQMHEHWSAQGTERHSEARERHREARERHREVRERHREMRGPSAATACSCPMACWAQQDV